MCHTPVTLIKTTYLLTYYAADFDRPPHGFIAILRSYPIFAQFCLLYGCLEFTSQSRSGATRFNWLSLLKRDSSKYARPFLEGTVYCFPKRWVCHICLYIERFGKWTQEVDSLIGLSTCVCVRWETKGRGDFVYFGVQITLGAWQPLVWFPNQLAVQSQMGALSRQPPTPPPQFSIK